MDTLVNLKPLTFVAQCSVTDNPDVRAFSEQTLVKMLTRRKDSLMKRWKVSRDEKAAIEFLFKDTLRIQTEAMVNPPFPEMPYLMVARAIIGKPLR